MNPWQLAAQTSYPEEMVTPRQRAFGSVPSPIGGDEERAMIKSKIIGPEPMTLEQLADAYARGKISDTQVQKLRKGAGPAGRQDLWLDFLMNQDTKPLPNDLGSKWRKVERAL